MLFVLFSDMWQHTGYPLGVYNDETKLEYAVKNILKRQPFLKNRLYYTKLAMNPTLRNRPSPHLKSWQLIINDKNQIKYEEI
jgi:hypothetical protein